MKGKTVATTLEDRLVKLETSTRRLRLILLGAVLAGATGVGVGMTESNKGPDGPPDVIRAKSFEVVNEWGEVLLRLCGTDEGDGIMSILNADGGPVVTLGSVDNAGVVTTYNSDGIWCVGLTATDEGAGSLAIYSSDGGLLSELSAADARSGRLSIYNSEGDEVVHLGSSPDGDGAVVVKDRQGEFMRESSGVD
ncbi:MAG: hypothetical protein ACF8R9_13490 [Phycisphaerales bacterium JB054]